MTENGYPYQKLFQYKLSRVGANWTNTILGLRNTVKGPFCCGTTACRMATDWYWNQHYFFLVLGCRV